MKNKHNVNGRRFYFGFIILLIGMVMIFEKTGIISWKLYDFLISWKMLLVAMGAFIFIGGNKVVGLVMMALGAFTMFPDIFSEYRDYFWPMVLILIGGSFIFGSQFKKQIKGRLGGEGVNVSSDYFDEFIIFGGKEISMSSNNLLGGKSTAIFGGAEVDLRQCEISPQGCTIELTTLFGGNVLKVPSDWTLLNKVTTIFGGYSDTRIKDPSYAPNPSKTVVITGACIFGGTEIRNFDKAN